MDGIIIINKPQGFTSFDVIAKLRGILREKRLGHSGTLDPNATGVLPVFAGVATRAIGLLPEKSKTYIATFRPGFTSDTEDIWGELKRSGTPDLDEEMVKNEIVRLCELREQIPPMYSAKKVDGVRLYKLARDGRIIERKPCPIEIYHSEYLGKCENGDYRFSVSCSQGTYIRTLCTHIGERLECGVVMSSLVRTSACGYPIEQSITLEELQKEVDSGSDSFLMPVSSAFLDFARVNLDEKQTTLYKNGVVLSAKKMLLDSDGMYAVYSCENEFLGIGKCDALLDSFKTYKMLSRR